MLNAKAIREALRQTQFELAVRSELSLRTVQSFELGRLTPTTRTSRKLAAAYQVTVDQVDALARGEQVEWGGAAAGQISPDLRADAALAIEEGQFNTPMLAAMFDDDERHDLANSRPAWLLDVRDGRLTPAVQERLARATTASAA